MLKRLYVDNYKCLVNFELLPGPLHLWAMNCVYGSTSRAVADDAALIEVQAVADDALDVVLANVLGIEEDDDVAALDGLVRQEREAAGFGVDEPVD